MKDFRELSLKRFSCRAYDGRSVDRTLLEKVFADAMLAPSAVNRQPWKFMIIDAVSDPEGAEIIRGCYEREWLRTASTYILAIGNHAEAWHRPCDGKDHTEVDLSIAVEHLCLAAADHGLGTCWVCNFNAPKLSEELGLKAPEEIIAIIPMGYPAEGTVIPEKKRKPLEEIIMWGRNNGVK
ncbi:MAG: nitroreductase family protein [Muribaculaceae bacterium]|nr:nitroreductase family protein [Muribaculaceae bacterium]